MVSRFSTTTRSTPASAAASSSGPPGSASIDRPGTIRSTSAPSPATVVTAKPKSAIASIHRRATTDTPSVGPNRKERKAQVVIGIVGSLSVAQQGRQGDLEAATLAMLEAHWRPEGYTSPNLGVYPWQWLWDSCFHAIAWAEAGDDRAV